jgi:hypothetical protein
LEADPFQGRRTRSIRFYERLGFEKRNDGPVGRRAPVGRDVSRWVADGPVSDSTTDPEALGVDTGVILNTADNDSCRFSVGL